MGCGCSSNINVKGTTTSIHASYAFEEKLGQGSFGQVRACVQRDTKLACAVKILDMASKHPGGTEVAEFQMERQCWERLGNNRHVVQLQEAYFYPRGQFSYFVMERCEFSIYDTLLGREGRLPESALLESFRQMLCGLQHCHSCGVIHRDVKPANFLVGFDGAVKLCDFGLSHFDEPKGVRGLSGTAPFMSPEMVSNRVYNCKTDIWSMGATAYLMLYGEYPFKISVDKTRSSSDVMKEAIRTNSPAPTFKAVKGSDNPSLVCRDFVQALLQREPELRPSADVCLQLDAMNDGIIKSVSAGDVGGAVKLARQKTAELKTPVDPTVAKTMDMLIEQLQAQHRTMTFARSFSLPTPESTTDIPSLFADRLPDGDDDDQLGDKGVVRRRSSRPSTFSGSLTLSMSALDPMSESTTASSDDITAAQRTISASAISL
jgi:serine/threonine protein kinase